MSQIVINTVSQALLPSLPSAFLGLEVDADREAVVDEQSSALQNMPVSQEVLDQLISLVEDVANKFVQTIESSSYRPTNEPLQLASRYGGVLKNIQRCMQQLQCNEESQGAYYYWRSKLGYGEYSKSKLTLLTSGLKASWKNYLKRCHEVADNLIINGQPLNALKVYKHLESVAPENGSIVERLGDCYYQIGQEQKAMDCFDKLLHKKVRAQRCYFKKANCLLELGRPKEAFDILQSLSQTEQVTAFKKEVLMKGIDSQLRLGNYLDAIHDALVAIQNYPEVDDFRKKLIDAYLAYSAYDEGQLFRKNFPMLCDYFSKQRCYSVVRRSFGDALQIVLDLFDYSAKKSNFALPLFLGYISASDASDEFLEICYDNVLSKLEAIEKKKDEILAEADTLREKIKAHTFEDEDETLAIANKLVTLPDEITGGKRAEIRLGLIEYNKFYNSVIVRLKEKQGDEWKEKLEQLEEKSSGLQKELIKLLGLFLNGDEGLGLRALFSKRLNIAESAKNLPPAADEVSAVDWIKRGNLMNFITNTFVPIEEREQVLKYLETQGIDIELIFRSDLMRASIGTKVVPLVADMGALSAFVKDNAIRSIADLKAYICK